jgi:glycosyltransferase involved in cell wall biosynthesis/SAM-dependent methyltransferase
LRIIFYSTTPNVGVGYGVLTKHLVTRMRDDGHFIKIATKHHIGNYQVIDGFDVFDGMDQGLVNKIADEENFDYIFTAMDSWTLEPGQFFKRWVDISFLDVEFIYSKMIQNLKATKYQIAITEHGKREIERVGFKPFYAPLGTDTKLFRPDDDLRSKIRTIKKWDDNTFVIGIVGLNYGTDRKNYIGLIKAFQGFHSRHRNSVLYLHTDVMGNTCPGIPMKWIIGACGFEETGKGPVQYANEQDYHLWKITQNDVADLYRAFDVFCLPSKGEGFGFPWLEAQACGTPTISTDTTSGKQLNFGGYVIPTLEDFYRWSTHYSWYVDAPPSAIDEQLEKAYQDWSNSDKSVYQKKKEDARRGALEYDWDLVYDKYWRPILKEISKVTVTIPMLPNYGTDLYETYQGKALMENCWGSCKNFTCSKLKPLDHPLLPGEWEGPAPMLQRFYPLVPDRDGKLMLDTTCSLYKWLSPRFLKESRKQWDKLMGYPKIREAIKKFWDEGKFTGKYVYLDTLPKYPQFDEGYKTAWQSIYFTSFDFDPAMLKGLKPGAKILDVGTGNGQRVIKLRAIGYDAIGTEINPAWVNNDTVVYGDGNSIPFPDDTFDMVLSVDVLEHMDDPLKGLSELLRVSKEFILVQITPTDVVEYWEDPTHRVEWNNERWQRELMSVSDEMTMFKNGVFLIRFLMKKKKEGKNENQCDLPKV